MGSSASLRDQTQVLHQVHMVHCEHLVYFMFVLLWCFLFWRDMSLQQMSSFHLRDTILLFFGLHVVHIVVWWLWLLNPDSGGLTILCLPCRSCPVVSSSSYVLAGNCRDGHFSVGNLCMPCFCFGITKNCQSTGRYRSQIGLRFTEEEDFKGTQMIKIQRFPFIYGFTIGECNWMVASNFGGDFMCNAWSFSLTLWSLTYD